MDFRNKKSDLDNFYNWWYRPGTFIWTMAMICDFTFMTITLQIVRFIIGFIARCSICPVYLFCNRSKRKLLCLKIVVQHVYCIQLNSALRCLYLPSFVVFRKTSMSECVDLYNLKKDKIMF